MYGTHNWEWKRQMLVFWKPAVEIGALRPGLRVKTTVWCHIPKQVKARSQNVQSGAREKRKDVGGREKMSAAAKKVKRRDEMAEGNSSNCFLSQSAAASRWPRRCQTSSTSQTHTNYTRELVCIFIGGANSGSWDYNDRWHRGGGVAAEEAWRREKDWGKIKRNKCYMWEITCWELTTMFQFGRAWASLYSANSYLCVPPSADMCTSPSPHRLPLPSRGPCLFSVIPLPPSILLSRKGNPSCS